MLPGFERTAGVRHVETTVGNYVKGHCPTAPKFPLSRNNETHTPWIPGDGEVN